MSIELSDRVQLIKPSPTLAVAAKAAELKRAGKDVIGLGAGEPDFDTPEHIKQAAIEALAKGYTKYTPVDGIPELKQAIIDKFARDNQLNYDPDQILVSVGGKQSCYNLCQAVLNDGDEVVIPAPYWVSYPAFALLAGATPVIVEAGFEQDYKITPDQLDAALTDKSRIFFFNSPSNPSGKAYTADELRDLAEVLKRYPNVLIATDDMYEHILWTDEPFSNLVNVCPELYERSVVLNGVSKAYSMTGWRIGFAGGPNNVINAMKKIQSHSTSNPCSIAQHAAVAALNGPQECVQTMVQAFKVRHDVVYQRLSTMKGVKVNPSDGTFYIFPDISEAIARIKGVNTCVDFAEHLLQSAGVAIVPGAAFGAPGCFRLSFAISMDVLADALNRIEGCL